jgi:hypothetical protein
VKLTEWLAVFGFILSVIALTWNVVRDILRSPRIHVEVERLMGIAVSPGSEQPPQPRSDTFRVTVHNLGSEPVTVVKIGLCDKDGKKSYVDHRHDSLVEYFASGPRSSLPLRIEGRDPLSWGFPEEALKEIPYWTDVYGYADRAKSLLWWRWWPRRHPSMTVRKVSSRPLIRTGGSDSYETGVEPVWVAPFTEVGLSQKFVAEIGISNFAFIDLWHTLPTLG